MVLPVGGPDEQTLITLERRGTRTVERASIPCRFVKLIGDQGWPADDTRED